MKTSIAFALVMTLSFGVPIALCDKHELPEAKISAQLQKVKKLVGDWKGASPDMQDGKIEVQYRLTSGGTAVVETIAPGTSHEMTTVYFDEDGRLKMTHYCMLGNHPTMQLTKEGANELEFQSDPKSAIKGEKHMHSLDIKFDGPNSIEHRWVMLDEAKKSHETVFKLERTS